MYEEPLPHCPLLIINGNNTSYKQGAKNVQDIREGSLDLVCKVQSTCCIIELSHSGTFLVLQNKRVLSPLVVDCHYKSLRGTAAVTYNSRDICSKNFVST